MNNFYTPIAVLVFCVAALGAALWSFQPDDTSEDLNGNITDSGAAETTDPGADTSRQTPMTACNALGTPIPVIRESSILENPKIVAALKDEITDQTVSSLIHDAPEDLGNSAGDRLKGMVWIPGGIGIIGSDAGPPDETPPHPVALDGFWMDITEVTNAQFKEFVDATGYVTLPEKPPELRSLKPGFPRPEQILEEFNKPGSICSRPIDSLDEIDPEKGAYSWWQYIPGANWKHPEGPRSTIDDRMDHPVVHVTWLDAVEYAKWRGAALPTEAQWEYAARGGLDGKSYPWGNDRTPNGEWRQNIWQGLFPVDDKGVDGFKSTAPVATFPANAYGLHDMSGNVWEWCSDYYQPDYYTVSPPKNPPGPKESFDPQEPGIIKRVQRGGSFMCSDEYCVGYRVSARMKGEEDTGAFHTGFRCIVTPSMLPTAR